MGEFKQKFNPLTGSFNLIPTNIIVSFKVGVAAQANLPLTGNTKGDARLVNDTGHLYVWTIEASSGLLTDWIDAGDIAGIDWSVITNKPDSLVANIDDAVDKKHTQNTDTAIDTDKLTVDGNDITIKNNLKLKSSKQLILKNFTNDGEGSIELGEEIVFAAPLLFTGIESFIFSNGLELYPTIDGHCWMIIRDNVGIEFHNYLENKSISLISNTIQLQDTGEFPYITTFKDEYGIHYVNVEEKVSINAETGDFTFNNMLFVEGGAYFRGGNITLDNTFGVVGTGLQLPHIINKVASANVRNSHNAEATTTSKDMEKLKTITLTNGLVGQLRILFDLHSDTTNTASAGVRRNGLPIGEIQTETSAAYQTKSQDITQTFSPGDTIELWAKCDATLVTAYIKNFKLAYDDSPTVTVASANS